jgi:hypothetical protein
MENHDIYHISQTIVKMSLEAILNMIARSTTGKYGGAISRLAAAGQKAEAVVKDAASPFLVEFFMVRGVGFQCMAYRNSDGKWRAAFDNRELPGSIHVLG